MKVATENIKDLAAFLTMYSEKCVCVLAHVRTHTCTCTCWQGGMKDTGGSRELASQQD